MLIRRAQPQDAGSIAAVHQATWENEQLNVEWISAALEHDHRDTVVAVDSDQIVGYVDGFMTRNVFGENRWEVDLLAVHPDARGQGLAVQMINQSLEYGQQRGAVMARSVVAHGNIRAEQSFERCGFKPDVYTCYMYIAEGHPAANPVEVPINAHLIPVHTLMYKGIWVEGIFSNQSFESARQLETGIAGVLIPQSDEHALQAAEDNFYRRIGAYRIWTERF